MTTPQVLIRRIQESPSPGDGYRVLVDRLWPRGLSRSSARLDAWARELAPSTTLRTWFAHDPLRFEEFRRRYLEELDGARGEAASLVVQAGSKPLTLLTAVADRRPRHAEVLRDFLLSGDGSRCASPPGPARPAGGPLAGPARAEGREAPAPGLARARRVQ